MPPAVRKAYPKTGNKGVGMGGGGQPKPPGSAEGLPQKTGNKGMGMGAGRSSVKRVADSCRFARRGYGGVGNCDSQVGRNGLWNVRGVIGPLPFLNCWAGP